MPNALNMASLSSTRSEVDFAGTAKRCERATSSFVESAVAGSRSRSEMRAAAKRRGTNALPASVVA